MKISVNTKLYFPKSGRIRHRNMIFLGSWRAVLVLQIYINWFTVIYLLHLSLGHLAIAENVAENYSYTIFYNL